MAEEGGFDIMGLLSGLLGGGDKTLKVGDPGYTSGILGELGGTESPVNAPMRSLQPTALSSTPEGDGVPGVQSSPEDRQAQLDRMEMKKWADKLSAIGKSIQSAAPQGKQAPLQNPDLGAMQLPNADLASIMAILKGGMGQNLGTRNGANVLGTRGY